MAQVKHFFLLSSSSKNVLLLRQFLTQWDKHVPKNCSCLVFLYMSVTRNG